MLQANKASLVAKFTVNTLSIRQMELSYWMSVFDKFAVLAAFLGGFASSVMMMDVERRIDTPGYHLLYVLSAGGAIGFNMVLLTISVMCSLWGPGKALTGQGTESYQTVIILMENMYDHCLFLFSGGLICYFFAAIFAVFCLFNILGSIIIIFMLTFFGRYLINHSRELKAMFVPAVFSTGKIEGNPVRDIGMQMTQETDPRLSGPFFDPSFATHI